MISGRVGSGKFTARPKQIRRVLEADAASTAAAAAAGGRTPETPVSRWQTEHVKMNGIRSAQPSGHSTSQCKLPLVALSRDAPHETGVDARLKFGRSVCLGPGVPVPNPQNAQAAETRPGCSGTYRSPGNTPPHPSLRSRQHLLFWLGGPCGSQSPANRQLAKCRTMCHPLEASAGTMRSAPQ